MKKLSLFVVFFVLIFSVNAFMPSPVTISGILDESINDINVKTDKEIVLQKQIINNTYMVTGTLPEDYESVKITLVFIGKENFTRGFDLNEWENVQFDLTIEDSKPEYSIASSGSSPSSAENKAFINDFKYVDLIDQKEVKRFEQEYDVEIKYYNYSPSPHFEKPYSFTEAHASEKPSILIIFTLVFIFLVIILNAYILFEKHK